MLQSCQKLFRQTWNKLCAQIDKKWSTEAVVASTNYIFQQIEFYGLLLVLEQISQTNVIRAFLCYAEIKHYD